MGFRPHNMFRVAAGAVLAAIALVFFGADEASVDPLASIRALARARQIAERSIRTGAVQPHAPYMCLKRCA